MGYNEWLSAEDIPLIRRLDYMVQGKNPMETGRLYAALRKCITFLDYNARYLSDEHVEEIFKRKKFMHLPKIEWVNQWMEDHGLEKIFTDVNNPRAIGSDYSYFWCLHSEKYFVIQEAKAILGISNRRPIDWNKIARYQSYEAHKYDIKLQKMIDEYVEKLKSELNQ